MTIAKRILFSVAAIATGFVGLCLVAEMLLRLLPVDEGLHDQPVTAENPIPHFEPNRTSTWSQGWQFSHVNKIRVNNYGFVNTQDYDPAAGTPLVAVIGDSYIQAAILPFGETLQARLSRKLGGHGRVYSFGISGTAFATYLVWAEYARDTFRPDATVFVIVGNDYLGALCKYNRDYYCFEEVDGNLQTRRNNSETHWSRPMLLHSALARYLFANVGILRRIRILLRGTRDLGLSTTPDEATPELLRDSRRAVDEFLAQSSERTHLSPAQVAFVLDAPRPAIYKPDELQQMDSSFFVRMRAYFITQAQARGYQVIDTQPYFIARHSKDGSIFEFPDDGHWNSVGHEVVADAVSSFLSQLDAFAFLKTPDAAPPAEPNE